MRAFLYGVCALLVLGVIQLWPSKGGLWLVQLSPLATDDQAVAQLFQMPVDLVDVVGSNSFLVKPHHDVSPGVLIQRGAVLVVEAPIDFGCVPPKKASVWQAKVKSL